MQFAYGLNYLIDNAHAIIVDVEATPARISKEVASTRTMLTRTAERLGLKPRSYLKIADERRPAIKGG